MRNIHPPTLHAENRLRIFLGKGNSMVPLLKESDLVYAKPYKKNEVDINDIILYKSNNKYVTHRVVYKKRNTIITKGDNNHRADSPIQRRQIIGRVYKVRRNEKDITLSAWYFAQSGSYIQLISKLLKNFKANHIYIILLKGFPLHLKYEKRIPQRIYVDIDLLIKREDRSKTIQELLVLGFEKMNESIKDDLSHLDYPSEESFVKKDGLFPIVIDLHYEAVFLMTQITQLDDLYPQKLLEEFTQKLFHNTTHFTYGEVRFPILKPASLLLYLLLHLFHHNYRGMYRIQLIESICIHKDIKGKDEVWRELVSYAKDFKLKGYVYGACKIVNKYAQNVCIPQWVVQELTPSLSQRRYVLNYLKTMKPYNDLTRVEAGVTLFKHIFFLSPRPFLQRVLIFVRFPVIRMIVFVLYNKAIWHVRIFLKSSSKKTT